MLNPFFLQGSKTEQGLVQDLINEQLKIYGIDVYYLPRQYITEKTIIKEVIESQFTSAFPIEAYIDSYEGYGGQGTILSKFGIQELDDLNLIISRERFESYITPLIQDLPDIKLPTRPKEGDLIYFPLGDRLFEIKYVEHEKPFYQLQKNYVYELRCELFRYGDEVIGTGINEIDDEVSEDGYIQTLQMIGIGETATAYSSIVNGGVRYVTVTNRGTGYKSRPDVVFSAAPTIGLTAVGIASMISNIVDFCEGDKNLYRVQSVELLQSGYGYTSPPMVSFIGGGGSGAKAVATIGDGIVGIITVSNGGSGYVDPPIVTFSGISSESARGVAVLNNSGTVVRINITNAGLGYTEPPLITISPPTINVGYGAYIYNEVIIGSSSGARARVRSWNVNTKILELGNISGDFIPGEILTGQKSNATYSLKIVNTDNLRDANDELNIADKYAQNKQIQIESDEIIDFSDKNPFGMP